MKRIVLILIAIGLILTVTPIISELTGRATIDEDINCSNVVMTYYYSTQCSHCRNMEPIISNLTAKGCSITKINIQEQPELAISNNIQYLPTLIFNNKRLVGEFTLSQVKDLIEN